MEIWCYVMITTKLCGKQTQLEYVLQVWNNLFHFKCNLYFKISLELTALFQVEIRTIALRFSATLLAILIRLVEIKFNAA